MEGVRLSILMIHAQKIKLSDIILVYVDLQALQLNRHSIGDSVVSHQGHTSPRFSLFPFGTFPFWPTDTDNAHRRLQSAKQTAIGPGIQLTSNTLDSLHEGTSTHQLEGPEGSLAPTDHESTLASATWLRKLSLSYTSGLARSSSQCHRRVLLGPRGHHNYRFSSGNRVKDCH